MKWYHVETNRGFGGRVLSYVWLGSCHQSYDWHDEWPPDLDPPDQFAILRSVTRTAQAGDCASMSIAGLNIAHVHTYTTPSGARRTVVYWTIKVRGEPIMRPKTLPREPIQ